MTKHTVRIAAALLVGGALLALPTSASAEPDRHVIVGANYTLELGGAGEESKKARLMCHPDAGSHPQAQEACGDLSAADGHIDAVPGVKMMCTKDFSPVTAKATGQWMGEERQFTARFSNPCEANAATGGHIFDF